MKKYLMILLSAFCAFSLKADVLSWQGVEPAVGARCEYTVLDDGMARVDKVYPLDEGERYNTIYFPPYLDGVQVSEFAENAFSEFPSLKEIHFTGGVANYAIKKIGAKAFANTNITSIEILPTVQTIGESAFAGCKSLTQFIVDEGAGFVTAEGGKLLLTKDHTTLIAATYNLEGALTLPGSLTKISGGAFNGNASLTSITLPMGLTEIGDEAFKETKLTAITIPASVKTIGEHAFQSARLLSTVNFNNGLETIKAGAFYNCSSLGYVTLPNTVKYVGEHVFESTLCKVVINFEHTNGFTVFENSFPQYNKYSVIRINEDYMMSWLQASPKLIHNASGTYYWGTAAKVRSVVNFVKLKQDTTTIYNVTTNIFGGGLVGGLGPYEAGATVTVEAYPDEDYTFSGWYDPSTRKMVSAEPTYTFTMPAQDVTTLTACFTSTLQLNAYIKARKLMPKNDAKQELLDAKDIYTEEGLKGLAEGAPLVKVKDSYATVKIAIQKVTDLEGQWQEAGSKEIPVRMKGTSNAAFYKVVKGE